MHFRRELEELDVPKIHAVINSLNNEIYYNRTRRICQHFVSKKLKIFLKIFFLHFIPLYDIIKCCI